MKIFLLWKICNRILAFGDIKITSYATMTEKTVNHIFISLSLWIGLFHTFVNKEQTKESIGCGKWYSLGNIKYISMDYKFDKKQSISNPTIKTFLIIIVIIIL